MSATATSSFIPIRAAASPKACRTMRSDASILAAVATKALNAAWYQKWFVHLRPRPESTSGLVHLVKSGKGSNTDVQPSKIVLNSTGLQQTFNKTARGSFRRRFPKAPRCIPPIPPATEPWVAPALRS